MLYNKVTDGCSADTLSASRLNRSDVAQSGATDHVEDKHGWRDGGGGG